MLQKCILLLLEGELRILLVPLTWGTIFVPGLPQALDYFLFSWDEICPRKICQQHLPLVGWIKDGFYFLLYTYLICYRKRVLLLLQTEKCYLENPWHLYHSSTQDTSSTPGWTITWPPAATPFLIYLFIYSLKILIGYLTRITLVLGFTDTQVVHKRLRAWLWHWQDLGCNPGFATCWLGVWIMDSPSVCLSVLVWQWGSHANFPAVSLWGWTVGKPTQHVANTRWM